MGNNIRSSSRPKALAPSIPMPPLADAMDAVHLSVERFCLLAGVEALAEMMEEDATTVSDKRLLKLIRGYLTAGVMENGLVDTTDEGTPQGGPLSPLLSNLGSICIKVREAT